MPSSAEPICASSCGAEGVAFADDEILRDFRQDIPPDLLAPLARCLGIYSRHGIQLDERQDRERALNRQRQPGREEDRAGPRPPATPGSRAAATGYGAAAPDRKAARKSKPSARALTGSRPSARSGQRSKTGINRQGFEPYPGPRGRHSGPASSHRPHSPRRPGRTRATTPPFAQPRYSGS